MRRRIRSVALTTGWMPSSSKYGRLRGLLTRAMIREQRYFSLAIWQIRRVSSSSPVGAVDAGALEDPQLRGVPVLDRVLELLLDRQVARALALDDRHLVALGDELAGEVPADLAGSGDDDVHELDPQRALEH